MGFSSLAPKSAALVEGEARVLNAAIGLVADREFALARAAMPDLASYFDYEDWLDSREGLQIGLAMAGVDAPIVPVGFAPFLDWGRLTEALLSERALDAFAALALAMRSANAPKVMARVSELEFEAHCRSVVAFAGRGDYRRWMRRRRTARVKVEAIGGRVEELPVRLADFLDWCACLGQDASEASLDRYAHLTLERLTADNYC